MEILAILNQKGGSGKTTTKEKRGVKDLGAPELLGGFAAGLALSRQFFFPFASFLHQANVGLNAGVLKNDVYASTILVIALTTLLAPFVLRYICNNPDKPITTSWWTSLLSLFV